MGAPFEGGLYHSTDGRLACPFFSDSLCYLSQMYFSLITHK